MKFDRSRAFDFGMNHFVLSLILGVIWWIGAYGSGLSDAYHEDPFFYKVTVQLSMILRTPSALLQVWHPFHKRNGVSLLVLLAIAFVWSMALGCCFSWIKGRFSNR